MSTPTLQKRGKYLISVFSQQRGIRKENSFAQLEVCANSREAASVPLCCGWSRARGRFLKEYTTPFSSYK